MELNSFICRISRLAVSQFLASCFVLILCHASALAQDIRVESTLIKLIDEIEVPAKEPGTLAAVKVAEGQAVERDELLARIEDEVIRLEKEQVEVELGIAAKEASNQIDVDDAQAELEVADREYERATKSRNEFKRAFSDSEIDHRKLDASRAAHKLKRARHKLEVAMLTKQLRQKQLDAADAKIKRRTLSAPFAGIVVDVFRRRGDWVEPGDRVVRLIRMDRLRAEGFLRAADARLDLVGSPVTVTVDLPEKSQAEFHGKVVFVSPEIDPVNRQVRMWAEVENPKGLLRPGLRATMTIESGAKR